ncbi:MAG: dUTP diphosphatase [Solirubrobacterales bacterium]
MARVEFLRVDERAKVPSRAHDGDAGLDLYAIEAGTIAPGERLHVGTGLAVAIPSGCAGLVLPRSGLASRHGVTVANAPGLIDSGYRGELQVILVNLDPDQPFSFDAGERIAQLLVVGYVDVEPAEADSLDETARGSGGFGSSGRA